MTALYLVTRTFAAAWDSKSVPPTPMSRRLQLAGRLVPATLLSACMTVCGRLEPPNNGGAGQVDAEVAGRRGAAESTDRDGTSNNAGTRLSEICEPFTEALRAVPHVSMSVNTGELVSVWDGNGYVGCEVDFETTDSVLSGAGIPDFDATEGSEMARAGWREMIEVRADGPGSGVFGLERNGTACVVRWEQPAYVDDAGEIVQAETFTMKVQCRVREPRSSGG